MQANSKFSSTETHFGHKINIGDSFVLCESVYGIDMSPSTAQIYVYKGIFNMNLILSLRIKLITKLTLIRMKTYVIV